jgi:hypothetical protein
MEMMMRTCLRLWDVKRRVLVKVIELMGMMMLRKVVKKGGSTLSGVSL